MAEKIWVGDIGSWNNASDWFPLGVPGPTDDAVIGAGADVEISSSVQVGSITLQGAYVPVDGSTSTLIVDSGATLSASGGVTFEAGIIGLYGLLANTTLQSAGGNFFGNVTFDNVTVVGDLILPNDPKFGFFGRLNIVNRVTLAPNAGQPGLTATTPDSSLSAMSSGSSTLDGGIALVGSASPSDPTTLSGLNGELLLGPNLSLDVIGSTVFAGTGVAGDAGPVVSEGTIEIAPRGDVQIQGAFTSTGAIHVALGMLDLSGAASFTLASPILMDDNGAQLVLDRSQTATVEGFRTGDKIYFKGFGPTGTAQAQVSGDDLQVVQGQHVVAGVTLAGQQAPGATYQAVLDGQGNILVTTTAKPAATVAFVDQTTSAALDQTPGFTGSHALNAASGGPGYLQWQYRDAGSDTVAMSLDTPNVFLKGGSGDKALAASSGQNVLDGGTGGAFLAGGSGTDTFFVDLRGTNQVWDTLTNFHAGDAVTVWGWVPGVNTETVDAQAGAAGYQGATLRLANGEAGGQTSSVTFAGLSAEQAAHLQTATGTAGGLPYLYVYNSGV